MIYLTQVESLLSKAYCIPLCNTLKCLSLLNDHGTYFTKVFISKNMFIYNACVWRCDLTTCICSNDSLLSLAKCGHPAISCCSAESSIDRRCGASPLLIDTSDLPPPLFARLPTYCDKITTGAHVLSSLVEFQACDFVQNRKSF